jgi:hypothetical protein
MNACSLTWLALDAQQAQIACLKQQFSAIKLSKSPLRSKEIDIPVRLQTSSAQYGTG